VKCFIVDDSPIYIEIVSSAISDFCEDIGSSTNPNDAVSKIIKFNPDVIIIDYVMPEKSGLELAKEISKNSLVNHIPIIMVSGENMVMKDYMGDDIDEFISKSESISVLKGTVKIFSNIGKINKATKIIDVNKSK